MSQKDVPKQVRIRTDPDKQLAYRYDAIQSAADRLECNRTKAVVVSCDAVGNLLDGVEEALSHEDLPPALARELAETISTRNIQVNYDGPEVSVDVD